MPNIVGVDPDLTTIAGRLRWARETSGLTTRALAAAAGVVRSYPSAVETGHAKNPGAENAKKLCDALGISASWLLYRDGKEPTERSLRAVGREILRKIERGEIVIPDGRDPAPTAEEGAA